MYEQNNSNPLQFGLHTEMRRLWASKGERPVVTRQIKYEWDYLYRSLDVMVGQAHFCQIPALNREWNRRYLEDLAGTEPDAVHVVIRDQAEFLLRDGDTRLPERIRITEYLMTSNQTFESERID